MQCKFFFDARDVLDEFAVCLPTEIVLVVHVAAEDVFVHHQMSNPVMSQGLSDRNFGGHDVEN